MIQELLRSLFIQIRNNNNNKGLVFRVRPRFRLVFDSVSLLLLVQTDRQTDSRAYTRLKRETAAVQHAAGIIEGGREKESKVDFDEHIQQQQQQQHHHCVYT